LGVGLKNGVWGMYVREGKKSRVEKMMEVVG